MGALLNTSQIAGWLCGLTATTIAAIVYCFVLIWPDPLPVSILMAGLAMFLPVLGILFLMTVLLSNILMNDVGHQLTVHYTTILAYSVVTSLIMASYFLLVAMASSTFTSSMLAVAFVACIPIQLVASLLVYLLLNRRLDPERLSRLDY